MRPGRAPNYRLREAHTIRLQFGLQTDTVELPQGTFVCPIERCYLPKDLSKGLTDSWEYKSMKDATDVVCYTRYRFHVIPRSKIEAL